jgi:hypothetical protein
MNNEINSNDNNKSRNKTIFENIDKFNIVN